MSASERPLLRRVALTCARLALWPFAWLSPRSGWARLYQRIRKVNGDPSASPEAPQRDPRAPNLRALTGPRGVLALLLCAALALWLRDVLKRPPPEPARTISPAPAAR